MPRGGRRKNAGRKRKTLDQLSRAERNIKWCHDFLRVPEGKHVGKPLRLAEFMKEDFRAIYGNPHGTRRAIISRARKNGKSIETAMMLLLHLCGHEAKENSQLYSAAQSRDQAGIVFNLAAKMVRLNPILNAAVTIRETKKELACGELGTLYRALSAETTTAFGLSPAFTIHDELGQVRGPRSGLFEALETATAAQEEPLTIIISTQAPSDADLLSILIDDANAEHDPHTVLRLQCAPTEMDAFSIDAIRAANPALEIFMNETEVLAMAEGARRMPARQAEFENLILNRRVETFNPFVTVPMWKLCGAKPEPLNASMEVYAGLDLSAVTDLTALVLIGERDKKWHVWPRFWLPREGLREKAQHDRVPYDQWAADGFLETTPGSSIAYEYVAIELRKVFSELSIRKLAFDRWGMQHLKPWLLKAGFYEGEIEEKFVPFGQGTQSMSPALRVLEEAIVEKKIAHGDHPVLAMCAACAVVESKDESNRKLSKRKSTGRIDGLVALAMAMGVVPLGQKIDVEALIA